MDCEPRSSDRRVPRGSGDLPAGDERNDLAGSQTRAARMIFTAC
jgi:hypothetical protein